MSYPDYESNPWKSLADLLSLKVSVATLTTAIEKEGIRTWDRFGRLVQAAADGANDGYSQAHALDLLAQVNQLFEETRPSDEIQENVDNYLEAYDCPLLRFGWPADECPDFEKYTAALPVPEKIKRAGQPQVDGPVGTKVRNSLDAIIRVLLKEAKMPPEPYKVAGIISDASSDAEGTCEVSRNCVADHLKRILANPRKS